MCKTMEVRLTDGSELAGTICADSSGHQQEDTIEECKRSGASPHGCIRTEAHGSGESYIPCLKETVGLLGQKYMF
jgi:hypothetical protein